MLYTWRPTRVLCLLGTIWMTSGVLWLFFGVLEAATQGDSGQATGWMVFGAVLVLLSVLVFAAALRRARREAQL